MTVLTPGNGCAFIRKFLLVQLLFYFSFSVGFGQNIWNKKADFAGAFRFGAVGFAIGDKGYIGTGFDGAGDRSDFWEYNPASNTWTQKADFIGTARSLCAGFSIGNKGFIGTGASGTVGNRDFFEYNQATNTWVSRGNIGGNNLRRFYSTGFAIGGKGYVATGTNGTQRRNDLIEYDTLTATWTAKGNFAGVAREQAVGFAIGGKGYIGTGYDGNVFLKDMWEYNPETDMWTQKADLIGLERAGAIGMAIGNLGFVGTGYNSEGDLADFYEFDPAANKWIEKADYAGGTVKSAVAFAVGGKGYVGTGTSNDFAVRGDFYEYTPGLTPVTITVGELKAPICLGQELKVPYTVTGDIGENNRFIVQLSAPDGTFMPLMYTLGTKIGAESDTAVVVIPTNLTPGTAYRIRVSSSNPARTSLPSPGFSISAPPEVSFRSSWDDLCLDSPIFALNLGSPEGGSYRGNGVIDELNFKADSAGIGSHDIVYTYIAPSGCSTSATQTIKVDVCTSISERLSESFNLIAYPNPYQERTSISYNLQRSANVILEIRNSLGHTIKRLEDGYQYQGEYTYSFSAEELGLPKGVYLVNLIVDNNSFISKILEY